MGSAPNNAVVSRRPPFTALQGQYLSFIHAYEGIHGCAPAEADFQRHFKVTPPSVHRMILTLERNGLIARVAGAARSIALRIPPAELPPLERHPPGASDRQRSQLAAVRSRYVTDATRRKASSSLPARSPAEADRVAEYIDSPMMTQRLRCGRIVSARIAGHFGDYRTQVRLTRTLDGDCNCPSDIWPCKHVRALHATWKMNPDSFFDADAFLRSLDSAEKRELIETIGKIVIAFPQTLGHFGVAGFDDVEHDEADYDDDNNFAD